MSRSSSCRPVDATFSYRDPETTILRGPFCYLCTNTCVNNCDKLLTQGETQIFLHYQSCATYYSLDDLIATNGKENPFLFRELKEKVRVSDCSSENCQLKAKKDRMFKLAMDEQSEKKEPLTRIPFLDGSTDASHPMTEQEVLNVFKHLCKKLEDFRKPSASSSGSLTRELIRRKRPLFGQFEVRCIHCRSHPMNTIDKVLEHILQASHIRMAYNYGLVFCKEKDLIPFINYMIMPERRHEETEEVNLSNLDEIIETYVKEGAKLKNDSSVQKEMTLKRKIFEPLLKMSDQNSELKLEKVEESSIQSKMKKKRKNKGKKGLQSQDSQESNSSPNSVELELRTIDETRRTESSITDPDLQGYDFTFSEELPSEKLFLSLPEAITPSIAELSLPILEMPEVIHDQPVTTVSNKEAIFPESALLSPIINEEPPPIPVQEEVMSIESNPSPSTLPSNETPNMSQMEEASNNVEFLLPVEKISKTSFTFEFDEHGEKPSLRTEVSSSGSYASTVKERVFSDSSQIQEEEEILQPESVVFEEEHSPPPSTSTTGDGIVSSPEVSDDEWEPPQVPLPVQEIAPFVPEVRQPPLVFMSNLSSCEIQANYQSYRVNPPKEGETESPIKTEEPKAVTMLFEGQRKFEKLDSNAYEEQEEQGSSVYFNARLQEKEEREAEKEIKLPEKPAANQLRNYGDLIAVDNTACDALQFQAHLQEEVDIAAKGCSLSRFAVLIRYMNVSCSSESHLLSDDILTSNSNQVIRIVSLGETCFESGYDGIRKICVTTCYVCGFISKCCCEYVLHMFNQQHIRALKQKKVQVSLKAFQFWFAHLQELREHSGKPLGILYELMPTDQPFIQTAVVKSLPAIPEQLISVSGELSGYVFLNADSEFLKKKIYPQEIKELPLEPNYLLKLGEAISVHYDPGCFDPKIACPYIHFYCPKICPVCYFESSCACSYITHLFGSQHLRTLNRNQVNVTLSDLRFWLDQLAYLSGHRPNFKMRPILDPLSYRSFLLPASDYPLFVLPSNHVYSPPASANTRFRISDELCKIQGPYCTTCMNGWRSYFTQDTDIFMHLKCYGKLYKMEELRRENGQNFPFTFTRLPEEVRRNPCYKDDCPVMQAIEEVRASHSMEVRSRSHRNGSIERGIDDWETRPRASENLVNRFERPLWLEERRGGFPERRMPSRERWERSSNHEGERSYDDGRDMQPNYQRSDGFQDRGVDGRRSLFDQYEEDRFSNQGRGDSRSGFRDGRDNFQGESRRQRDEQFNDNPRSSQDSGENLPHQAKDDSPPGRNLICRNLPLGNPVYISERRPVEFPLLHGTCYKYCKSIEKQREEQKSENESNIVAAGQWTLHCKTTREIYSRIKDKKAEVKLAFDSNNWKTINCEVCESVDPDEPYVEHVLSSAHYSELKRRDRWITIQHFDRLDFFLKTLEKNIKTNNAKDYDEWTSLQQIPLFPKWNCENSFRMPRYEYDEKLDELQTLLTNVESRKLNQFQRRMSKDVCFWCSGEVQTLTDALNHLVGKEHRDIAFTKFNIQTKSLNEYIAMARQSQRDTNVENSPSPKCFQELLKSSASTASLLSSSSSIVKKVPPATSFPPPRSVNGGKLQLPFLIGYEKPVQPLTVSEASLIGSCAKDIILLEPKFKATLCIKLKERGEFELECKPCEKTFPNPSACLEHTISVNHINKLNGMNRGFSKVYDACVLITIVLESLEIDHEHISMENVEKYFNLLQNRANALKEKKESLTTVAPSNGTKAPVPFTISKLEEKPSVLHIPFLIPTEKSSDAISEKDCLDLTKPLRRIICENEKTRNEIKKCANLTNIKCNVCNNRKVFPTYASPYQLWEHIVSSDHISNAYKLKKQFSLSKDYLAALKFLSFSTTLVTAETASTVLVDLMNGCSNSVPKSKSKKVTSSTSLVAPYKPNGLTKTGNPIRSFSSLSIPSTVSLSSQTNTAKTLPNVDHVLRCKIRRDEDDIRCVTLMHKFSDYGITNLSNEQLQSLCEAVKKEFHINNKKCYRSSYGDLAQISPHVRSCPICKYRPLCCCDYAIHIFSQGHFDKLKEKKTQVTVFDVNFWLNQLLKLKMNSIYQEDDKDGDIIARCWEAISLTPMSVDKALPIEQLNPNQFIVKE